MPTRPEAFFLPSTVPGQGQRFCLFYKPNGPIPHGLVVYVHPFAEEMNKARRMAALQSRAFANAGYAVLQIDLLGCGDSSGDFGDATWQTWVNDVVQACQWVRQRAGASAAASRTPTLWLWGLRAGCLLACDAATHLSEPCNFLFWQAPASGKPLLQQFLRLKVAGDMLGGQGKGIMEGLRQQLDAGSSVEIAGYTMASDLASGLEQAQLEPPTTLTRGRVAWMELSTREAAALTPVSTRTVAHWQTEGWQVASDVISGPAFWQTSEIETAPDLISASLAAVSLSLNTSTQ